MFTWIRKWLKSGESVPEEWMKQRLSEVKLLAVDLELTSLNIKKASITSVGWVEGKGASLSLDSCIHRIVHTSADLAQSPVIHGLTREHIDNGVHIRDVLEPLKEFANTHVWVCHNAALDAGALAKAFYDNNVRCEPVVVIDTLILAVYQLRKRLEVVPDNCAGLAQCRERLGLPAAPAHNSLDDALATLQLWFAQNTALNGGRNTTLADLLHTGALTYREMQKN